MLIPNAPGLPRNVGDLQPFLLRRDRAVSRASGLGFFLVFVTAFSGCNGERGPAGKPNLVLLLPPSEEFSNYDPPRVSKLTIDGKDFTEPRDTRRELAVVPKDGKNTVTVVFSFWTNNYINFIRTKKVKLEEGKVVEADLRDEDPANPDLIKPIYFPTPPQVVDAMCDMAKLTKDDMVYDIGCGDGRLIITGVKKFHAGRGVGIDIRPELVQLCRENAKKAGVADRLEFREQNALTIKDLSKATVVFLYLGDDLNMKLRPILQTTLKPGSRVVSHRFEMGDWKPDVTRKINAKNNFDEDEDYLLHLWTITAATKKLATADPPAAKPNLILHLPESYEYPDYDPPRVSKLTIDGKDFTEPRGTRREISVKPKAGKDTVTVVFGFWTNNYINIIRTRKVKLEDGKVVEADLTKEDLANPDLIKPIYFPTPPQVVDAMCDMAKLTKDDVVYDIGCGDGRLVIAGVKKFHARRGVGIDIRPELVKLCRENARKAGVADRVEFREQNALMIKDLSDATVVFLYLGDDLNMKLRPILQKTLKPGSRVVSHRFEMGDWKPNVTKKITAKNNYNENEDYVLHLWNITAATRELVKKKAPAKK
jgi:cyclopropane fatty-acyl-phospholipid synthase-like methyltransferase